MCIRFINKGGNSGDYIVPDGVKFTNSIIFPTGINTKNVMDMSSMFENGGFSTVPQIDTSNVTNMKGMFANCSNLTAIPQLNTSKVTTMQSMFVSCGNLTTIPQLDASNIVERQSTQTYNKDIFTYCYSLSDESLNNILAMCINMGAYSSHKTLKRIGLTSAQAAICQELSNYQAFLNAGWTTGY